MTNSALDEPRNGNAVVAAAASTPLMRVRQRLQQQRAQHGEDAGVHADAEREGQHGRRREGSMFREAAQREPHITVQR